MNRWCDDCRTIFYAERREHLKCFEEHLFVIVADEDLLKHVLFECSDYRDHKTFTRIIDFLRADKATRPQPDYADLVDYTLATHFGYYDDIIPGVDNEFVNYLQFLVSLGIETFKPEDFDMLMSQYTSPAAIELITTLLSGGSGTKSAKARETSTKGARRK